MRWRMQMLVAVVLVGVAVAVAGESKYPTEVQPAPGALSYFHGRLVVLAKRLAARPRAKVLASYGIGKEHDAMERASKLGFLPPSIGRAGDVREAPTLFFEADPALTLAVASAFDSEHGRAPSQDEIEQELAAFDARIAEVNTRLAEQRDRRAAAYRKTGRIPEDLEREAIDPFLRDDVAPESADGPHQGSDPLRQLGRRIDLITQHLNQATTKR
jgi:hypothetical protein